MQNDDKLANISDSIAYGIPKKKQYKRKGGK